MTAKFFRQLFLFLQKRVAPYTLAFVCLLTSLFLFYPGNNAQAVFSIPELETHIYIDGTDYGPVTSEQDLVQISNNKLNNSYTKLSLQREFVTERSLYNWAHQSFIKTSKVLFIFSLYFFSSNIIHLF